MEINVEQYKWLTELLIFKTNLFNNEYLIPQFQPTFYAIFKALSLKHRTSRMDEKKFP